jgi:hypothetical protein
VQIILQELQADYQKFLNLINYLIHRRILEVMLFYFEKEIVLQDSLKDQMIQAIYSTDYRLETVFSNSLIHRNYQANFLTNFIEDTAFIIFLIL